MATKKFYAYDMQEALRQIKEELGPNAVIVSSKVERAKKGPLGIFSKKVIEVVVSYEEEDRQAELRNKKNNQRFAQPIPRPQPSIKPQTHAKMSAVPARPMGTAAAAYQNAGKHEKPDDKIAGDLGEIKKLIEQMSNKVEGIGKDGVSNFTEETAARYRRLLEQDVDKKIAKRFCEQAQDISARKGATVEEVLRSLLIEAIGQPNLIVPTKFQRKVIMVIGPTGVGKTTTLVKLASNMIVNQGLKVGMVNSDVYRVGAQEHLKTYCDILDTPMLTIYKPEDLEEALESVQDADVVFIDTAGKVSQDEEYQKEIAKLVEIGKVDDIYLTISASTSMKAMKTILKNYAFLNRHSLLVTKLDEMGTMGPLLNARQYSGRPLSYITLGQTVPEDIAVVQPQDMVNELLG